MIDREAFANWTDKVTKPNYKARHEFMQVWTLPDYVMADSAVQALNPLNDEIHISDHQLRHAMREIKNLRGASLPENLVRRLPDKLENARWFYDSKHGNLLAVFNVDITNTVGKSVLVINFKKGKISKNAIVTSGIIEPAHLTNPIYREINETP